MDEDDAGSLVDFIVDDEPGDGGHASDGAESDAESDAPATREEALARDLDGIDSSNIVTGKRQRRQTQFFERQVFASDEYRRMVLQDVPKQEMSAVMGDDSGAEDEEEEGEEDADFEATSEASSEEEGDSDDEA